MQCTREGDVHEFLASLCYKREKLAATGVTIIAKEYEHTILHGIPTKLATFALHITSVALLVHNAASINIDTLINQINEEAKQLKS